MSGNVADVGDTNVVDGGDGEMGVGGSDAYANGTELCTNWCVGLSDAGRRRRQLSNFAFGLRAIQCHGKRTS